jgi:serine/threonine protein kinase
LISGGYQGSIYLVEADGGQVIVKAAHGRGPARWIRRAMLRNEHRVYEQLVDVPGIPRCYGLVDGRYLVLEYIRGDNIRNSTIHGRKLFFDRLLQTIQSMHGRQVAHGDLKNRDNIFMDDIGRPYVLDFGIAVVRRPGFRPVNHLRFRLARSWDLNAWVKHRHPLDPTRATEAERSLVHVTSAERLAGLLRPGWIWFRRWCPGLRKRS